MRRLASTLGFVLATLLLPSSAVLGPFAASSEPALEIDIRPVLSGERLVGLDTAKADFFISPKGVILILAAGNIFDFSAGTRMLEKDYPGLSDFEIVGENAILVVNGGKLGYCFGGRVVDGIRLPSRNMRITRSGDDILLIYGPVKKDEWALYIYKKGADYTKYLESPIEITAAAQGTNGIYFAVKDTIYFAEPEKPLGLVFYRKDLGAVRSMAFDESNGNLVFSTDDAVYLLRGNSLAKLTEGIGGTVRFQGDLFVMDRRGKGFFRISGLPDKPWKKM